MGVIVISLRTPRCARDNIGCTFKHLGALATSLEASMTSLGAHRSASNKPGSTSNHRRAV